jgi:RND family efflux transporter MFP subunit
MFSPISRTTGLIAALASALFLSACSKTAETVATSKPALKVRMVQAKNDTIINTVSASGTVMAKDEILLGVELSGLRVVSVLSEVGEAVKAGQVILKLDTRSLEVELVQARAQMQQASAALMVAEADAKRGAELRKRGLVSQRDTDQTTANLMNARAGIELARAGLESAQLRLSFATLKAPSDGVISARTVQTGQVVVAAGELFRMIKNGALEWRAELNEAQFLKISVGDAVKVQTESAAVAGRVRAIDAGLQMKTRTGVIYVDLPKDALLRAGTFAQGEVQLGARPALLLPARAVIQRDGYAYVFTVSDGVANQKQVQTGASIGERVEILSGVNADTPVIAEGGGFLADGDRVEIVAGAKP